MKEKIFKKSSQFEIMLLLIAIVIVSIICVWCLIRPSLNKSNISKENISQTMENGKEETVYVYGWNDCDNMHAICNIESESKDTIHVDNDDCITTFSTKKSIDEIGKDSGKCIDSFKFFFNDELVESKLLFDGMNYFALFQKKDDYGKDYFVVASCKGTIYNGYIQDIFFPCPSYTVLDYDLIKYYDSYDSSTNLAGQLFNNYSFEFACEFYGRLSDEYVIIDKENKTIILDAYHPKSRSVLDEYITLDWKNKTYTYDDIETGEHIVFDGYPKKEAPLTKTISAGSWNGNEQDFDLLKIHEVDTVEYNNEGLEIAADMFKSSDKYPAVADGVEEIEDTDYYPYDYKDNPGKLIFGNNNYYIMYYLDSKEKYIISNCCGMADVNNDDTKELLESMSNQSEQKEDILFPMPGRLVLSDFGDKDVKKHSYYAVLNFFNRIDFDYASEFYGRFTNDCAGIDIDDQTITVDGYDRANDEYIEDFITIDWKNKTFTYTDPGSGEKVVYEG